jgi:hypothetical protein
MPKSMYKSMSKKISGRKKRGKTGYAKMAKRKKA